MLCRGRGIRASELEHLHFAANQSVRLVYDGTSRADWPSRLKQAIGEIQPVAIFFDPLARVKGDADENSQRELAPVLDFMRELRELGDCSVGFVHHSGHADEARMRGTSDLGAYWESRLTIRREGATCSLTAEHREAEATERLVYRLDFDRETRSLRLEPEADRDAGIRDDVVRFLAEHPDSTFDEVREALRKRKAACRSQLDALIEAGTVMETRTERPDRNGRPYPRKVFNLAPQAGFIPDPDPGTDMDLDATDPISAPRSPLYRRGTGTGIRIGMQSKGAAA
jgi:hypothetical protein